MQLDPFAATQFDNRQANRIRTSRRPGGKHAMRPIVGGRVSQQFCSPQFLSGRAIELPDDEEMREAFDVSEPGLKLRQDLEHAIGIVFGIEALGNLARALVRTTYKSNRLRCKHRGRASTNSRGCPAQALPGRGLGEVFPSARYDHPQKNPAQAELGGHAPAASAVQSTSRPAGKPVPRDRAETTAWATAPPTTLPRPE